MKTRITIEIDGDFDAPDGAHAMLEWADGDGRRITMHCALKPSLSGLLRVDDRGELTQPQRDGLFSAVQSAKLFASLVVRS